MGTLLRTDDNRLPKRIFSGGLENERNGPREEEKGWMNCVAEDRGIFELTENWSTVTLNPGVRNNTAYRGIAWLSLAYEVMWLSNAKEADAGRY